MFFSVEDPLFSYVRLSMAEACIDYYRLEHGGWLVFQYQLKTILMEVC